MYIFLFWSPDVIFSTQMKNMWKKLKFKNEFRKNKFLAILVSRNFGPKIAYTSFSLNDFFAQISFSIEVCKPSKSSSIFDD